MDQTQQTAQFINIDSLVPHPENQNFFRDLNPQELKDFAQNIEEIGMKEPIVITPPDANGRHTICAGHQRVRAYQLLGRKEILAIVDPSLTDPEAVKKALLSTNFFTRNLSHQEIVKIVKALTDMQMPQKEIAQKLGKSRNTIAAFQRHGSLVPRLQEMTVDFPRDLILAIAGLDPTSQEGLAEMLGKISSKEEILKLQKRLQVVNSELSETILARETAKKQKVVTEAALEKREAKIRELQTRLEEIEADHSEQDYDPDQIEEYETQLSELREELSQKTSEYQNLKNAQEESLAKIQAMETELTNKQAEIREQIDKIVNKRVTEHVEMTRRQLAAESEQKDREYQNTIQEMQDELEELKNRPVEPPTGERLEGYDLSLHQELAALEGISNALLGKAIAIERKITGRLKLPDGAIREVHLKAWSATTKKIAEIDDIMSQLAARTNRENNDTAVPAKTAGGRR